jgi:copper resistance protein C
MTRLLTALALAVGVLLAGAAPALAHNVLVSTDPPNGASVAVGPQQVRLTYDQPVQTGSVTAFNTVTVTGPNGTRWETGTVTVEGNTVTAPLHPLGPAGAYTIAYRILSADGHPVEGTVRFTLTTAGTGTPTPPAANQPPTTSAQGSHGNGGMPVWPWIVGAAALLTIGVVLALRIGRTHGDRRE